MALIISASKLCAQWTEVAPGLLGPIIGGSSAVAHKDGVIWAGHKSIHKSTDEGVTWSRVNTPFPNNDWVRHLDFWDAKTGLLSSELGNLYITHDQGATWKLLKTFTWNWGARFVNSPSRIIVPQATVGDVAVSSDQGLTWTTVTLGAFVPFVDIGSGGNVYALVGKDNTWIAHLQRSTDYGYTWTTMPGQVGFDSYTIGLDPCSEQRIYVANEDAGGSPNNKLAELFVTSDGGVTWDVTYSNSISDLCGSIYVASNSIYAQRIDRGILRSTDFGTTWVDIGGPSAPYDSRTICAVTDNLLLAADKFGSIWRTTNSGSDSVQGIERIKSLTYAPEALFLTDTLLSCDPPELDTAIITSVFCTAPRIAYTVIEGEHAADFVLLQQPQGLLSGEDTIIIRFAPNGNGERRANVKLVLQDSSRVIIPLRGWGKGKIELTLGSTSIRNDTIGTEVYLPITLESLGERTGIELTLRFDTDQLEYVRAIDRLGNTIDLADLGAGRKRIGFDDGPLQEGGILGYAIFRIYPKYAECVPVYLDSITLSTAKPPCAFAVNPKALGEICMPDGCMERIIAQNLRYAMLPELAVAISAERIQISSRIDLGPVRVTLFDLLGKTIAAKEGELVPAAPIQIPGPAPGLYVLTVTGDFGILTRKLLIP